MSATRLNTEMRDQFLRLYGPPRARAYKDPATPQSVTSSATLSLVTLTLSTYDTSYSGATLLQSGNRLVVPIAGLYHVTVSLMCNEDGGNILKSRITNVRRNSANSPTGGTSVIYKNNRRGLSLLTFATNPVHQQLSKIIPCNAGDHLQLFFAQNSGVTKTIRGGKQRTFMEAIWRGVLPAGTP